MQRVDGEYRVVLSLTVSADRLRAWRSLIAHPAFAWRRPLDNFPHGVALEFRNHSTRLWESPQLIDSTNQPGHDNGSVVRGALLDERTDRNQVRDGLVGPANRRHARKRFLTSS